MRLGFSKANVLLWGSICAAVMLVGGCGDDDSGSGTVGSGGGGGGGGGPSTVPPSSDPGNNQNTGSESSGGGSTISTGGAQDFGYFRQLLQDGEIPRASDIDDQGFFAEHSTPLPSPDCGELVCLHAMLGVMGNLINGANCTVLQLGMNTPITPETLPRLPLNMAVVIDVSGSMASGDKMAYVREGLHTMIDALEDEDTVSMITYSTRARVVLEPTDVRGNRHLLRSVVDALEPDGSTDLYAGLELGYEQVMARLSDELQNRLIILSDGQPTAGNTSHSAIIAMSRSYNLEGIGLTTIGVGSDFNEALMRELAEQGDGNFYFVESRQAIEEVFTEEVETFVTAIAEDLAVSLQPGTAYRVRGVFGTKVWEDEGVGGVIRIPSVFLAHRQSHDDNEQGRRGGGSAILVELMPDEGTSSTALEKVADVSLSYYPRIEPNRWGDDLVRVEAEVTYPGNLPRDLEEGYFAGEAIRKNFVMLNIFAGFQMASNLFYSGRADEALAAIESLADRVEEMNLELGDEDLEDDLRLLRLFAQNLREHGAGLAPEPPEDSPWPRD